MITWFRFACWAMMIAVMAASAAVGQSAEKKKLLLLGQSPDGHPRATHEYMPGMRVLSALLEDVPNLEVVTVKADDPWDEGPNMLRDADGVVLFLSEGSKWIHSDPRRLEAFAQLAANRGALVCLHWGMGAKDARYVDGFLKLFGGCHGGPDRKYKVLDATMQVTASDHPIVVGLENFRIHDEFYYRLKLIDDQKSFTPILKTEIDGRLETVAWAWERPDHGRSFGFSGCHFHENWRRSEYRRLVAQGILWSLQLSIPSEGLSVEIDDNVLKLP